MGEPVRILLVGAGAVGQVYGQHLQKGGAEVHFLVRPKYADAAREGFTLYPLNKGPAPAPERLAGHGVLTSAAEVESGQFDQIWLCVSTPALDGDWLPELLDAAGPDVLLVAFQPGMRVAQYFEGRVPPERLVRGMIPFSSWPTPLAGVQRPEPGHAWWMAPPTKVLFQGPQAEAVAALLNRGGLRAAVGDAERQTAKGSSLLLPIVAALEVSGWSFARMRRERAGLAAEAVREALEITARDLSVSPWPEKAIAWAGGIRLLTRAAVAAPPFDFERFLELHFTKVGEQTRRALGVWIREGETMGAPTQALRALAGALDGVRPSRTT